MRLWLSEKECEKERTDEMTIPTMQAVNDKVAELKQKGVINSTLYETDDLLKVIAVAMIMDNGRFSSRRGTKDIKLRYMNELDYRRPHNKNMSQYSHASRKDYGWTGSNLELAIVRPKKIQVNALSWLAQSSDADVLTVPEQVLKDIAYALDGGTNYLYKALKQLGLSVTMNKKAKDRKAYSKAMALSKLNATRYKIECSEQELAACKARIPNLQYEIAALTKALEKDEEAFKKKYLK